MDHYIYLLQEREFIKTNENIYKIGKTKQKNLKRYSNYPNGSKLIFQSICTECDICEKNIVEIFKQEFILRKDIGNEYFEGNFIKMIEIIYKICLENLNNYDLKLDENNIININSYQDLIKYTDIKNIIISNPETKEGFIKFQKNSWKKLYDYNEKTIESLEQYINIEFSNNYKIINDIKYELKYDIKSIINDIMANCVILDCKEYKLENHEYFIKTNTEHNYGILDTRLLTIFDYTNHIANDKILCSDQENKNIKIRNFDFKNINISIVDKILKHLIRNDDIYKEYKRFCYNTIVSQEYSLIFHDDNYYGNLSFIFRYFILNLSCNSNLDLSIDYDKYIKNKDYYEKSFKINPPKIFFIYSTDYTDSIGIELINLGIKNIMVYNYKPLDSNNSRSLTDSICHYLNDIYEIINKDILYKKDYITKNTIKNSYLNIFIKSNLLFINYIKWCCTL